MVEVRPLELTRPHWRHCAPLSEFNAVLRYTAMTCRLVDHHKLVQMDAQILLGGITAVLNGPGCAEVVPCDLGVCLTAQRVDPSSEH